MPPRSVREFRKRAGTIVSEGRYESMSTHVGGSAQWSPRSPVCPERRRAAFNMGFVALRSGQAIVTRQFRWAIPLGDFRRVLQRKNRYRADRTRVRIFADVRLFWWQRRRGSGRSAWLAVGKKGDRSRSFAAFFQPHNIFVRNFPAEMLHLAALLQVLLEKDRTARVCDKRSGSRIKIVAGAVMHLDPAP